MVAQHLGFSRFDSKLFFGIALFPVSGSFECHLCNSNCASPITVKADSFSLCTFSVVSPHVITSSTHGLFLISSIAHGYLSYLLSVNAVFLLTRMVTVQVRAMHG